MQGHGIRAWPPPFCFTNATDPMSSVAKSIELLAEGDTLEDATEAAVEEASKTISNIQNVYVDNYRAVVEDGEIQAYRVHTKITFVLQGEGAA
jgi:flavin-binding protein dodecin